MLQGGGALGSYQAGAFEALATSDYVPDWIAGNAPEHRRHRLRAFWEDITAPSAWWPSGLGGALPPRFPPVEAASCPTRRCSMSSTMFRAAAG